jgi:acetyl esterase/lipase
LTFPHLIVHTPPTLLFPPAHTFTMDSGLGLLKFLFPQIPSLANTAVWHTLGMTETSSKWDLRTTLTVQVLRQMMKGGGSKPSPIGKVQATTLKDPGIKGKIWIAKDKIKAPGPEDESLRAAVFKAIDDMKDGEVTYTRPDLVDTEVEWTGCRPGAGKEDPLPDISEAEKYKRLLDEPSRTSETTLLYFHGGAYYLCDPTTHRVLCSRLAKETHGRVCSVRYRLAPQTAFPGQLLDAFMMYLSLLYPPPGSLHEAIPAKNIVFAGDSAGGNLTFALMQLLLQLHRTSEKPSVRFHGKQVDVPLPAAACANSGWFDIARAMPSIISNQRFDYLPAPNHDDAISRFSQDDVWPTSPPRGDLFCDLSLLDHPLVSPLAASDWSKAPPLWFCTGQECLTDEDRVVAAIAASQGVQVQWEEYEAMPHCFAMLIPGLATGDRCLRSWGDFCRHCVEDPSSVKTNGTYIYAKSGKEEVRDVKVVTDITLERARQLMRVAKDRRFKGYEKEGKAMPKPAL